MYSQSSLLVYAEITLFPESHFSLETIDGVRLTEREGGGKSRKKEEEEGQLSFRSKEDLSSFAPFKRISPEEKELRV